MTTTFTITNGDVVISEASGQPGTVADGTKVRQDVKEALSTAQRVDNIGAGLDDLIGQPGDVLTLRADLTRRVRSSLGRMQDLQTRFHLGQRPTTERIARLVRLDVFPLEGALTSFAFRVEVQTIDGGRLALTGTIQG